MTADPATLAAELDAVDETSGAGPGGPDFNVAPTTPVLTVVRRHDRDRSEGTATRRIRRMRWGLVPSWAKELGAGPVLFNARADTVATKPAFRSSFRSKRCLVPMDGWYEWQVEPVAGGKTAKIPYFMSPTDGSRLFMAGLWSVWHDPAAADAPPVLSATILTTDAVGELERVHDRMPLMLPRRDWDDWLDPDRPADPRLLEAPAADLTAAIEIRRVSRLVNSVRNNGPELIRANTPNSGGGDTAQLSLL